MTLIELCLFRRVVGGPPPPGLPELHGNQCAVVESDENAFPRRSDCGDLTRVKPAGRIQHVKRKSRVLGVHLRILNRAPTDRERGRRLRVCLLAKKKILDGWLGILDGARPLVHHAGRHSTSSLVLTDKGVRKNVAACVQHEWYRDRTLPGTRIEEIVLRAQRKPRRATEQGAGETTAA